MVKQNEARRKAWRVVFTIITVSSMLVLIIAFLGYIRFAAVTGELTAGSSVIGGEDGPTSIFVSGVSFNPIPIAIIGAAAVVSAIGLHKTRKKDQH